MQQSSTHTSTAIQTLVHSGREKFLSSFPGDHHCFDEMSWSLRGLIDRPAAQHIQRVYFTRYGTQDQALPSVYTDVVKSWIILERQSISSVLHRNDAARMLWEAILLRRGNDPTTFCWQNLCEEDLSQTETLMSECWGELTVYKAGNELLAMVNFLAARSVCRKLYYTLRTPHPGDISKHVIANQEARKKKLPSMRALEGVADIYHTYAKDPGDRLLACALAILVVTGFRLGELLTLPLDCEVTEVSNGKTRYGIRYYKEKAKGTGKMLDVRWLTAIGAELAQKTILEIREITSPIRQRAKILEDNPHRVPIPGYQWNDHMSPDEVAYAIGLKNRFSVYRISPNKLCRHEKDGVFFYLASEVESYLLSERTDYLWTLDRRDGSYQMLSETLFIVFSKHFRNPLLVESMSRAHIMVFLAGRSDRKSAFERFNIREENGNFCKLISHQFRHWINDLADKGGLSTDLQTRWLGRENLKDTQAYQHATVEEKLQWLKNGIRNGEICGTIASVYFALPEEERDVFLDGQIQAVHFTPLGLCIHDFAIDPCPYYLNCVRGCSEYLRTKGNQKERANLIQVQRRTKQALEVAKKQAAEGNGEATQAWIQHYEDTLIGVQTALAVDDDLTMSDGTVVQPFKDQASRFQSL